MDSVTFLIRLLRVLQSSSLEVLPRRHAFVRAILPQLVEVVEQPLQHLDVLPNFVGSLTYFSASSISKYLNVPVLHRLGHLL